MTIKIIANIFGVLTAVTLVISFQIRSNKKLYAVQALANVFYGLQFLLLGAMGGFFNTLVRIVRNLMLSKADRWPWIRRKWLALVFSVPSLLFLIFGWSGPIDLLPFATTVVSNLTYWSNDARTIRVGELAFISPSWAVYDALTGAYGGILNEAILMCSIIVSFIRFGWKGMKGSGDAPAAEAPAAGDIKEDQDVQRDAQIKAAPDQR
ncbi:MAG: YgjV family protein [Eubacterium sp.]|nr:YgjV family protein [Eubacterium sp.]